MQKRVVVAIDGPAGAGKSTVARELAQSLGYTLLDTGALYRTVALAAHRAGTPWDDEGGVTAIAEALAARGGIELQPADGSGELRVVLDGDDVSAAIRTPEMSMGASRVSAVPGVRAALLDLQRKMGARGGVVAEGRDIGTVVFPSAEVKFFVTASVDVRAQRRHAELLRRGEKVELEQVRREVIERDKKDSERAVAPLRQAPDAHLVDSTGRTVAEIVAEMKDAVERAARG